MTLRQRLLAARARLIAAGVDNNEAVLDTNLLARHVLGYSRSEMLLRQDDPTPDGFEDAFNALIERRARREPAAYIRGLQEFWSRDFEVTPDVLIPRPESELIVEELLALLPIDAPALPRRVADIGTGSGCIAVTVAAERPHVHLVATDISRPALDVARKNAARAGVSPRIEFLECAYLSGTTGTFDFILSNPPYVTAAEYEQLQPEVREYEPEIALQAGEDGLRDIRQIVDVAAERLKPGGTLFMEIGHQQAEAIAELVKEFPSLTLARISNDLQRIPRVAVIERRRITDVYLSCLFCKIIAGEVPASKIYEDDRMIAFTDINPQAPMHVLVVPRKHVATLNDLTAAEDGLVGAMVRTAAAIAKDNGYDGPGYRTVFNCNAQAGQTVFHIHLHVLGGRSFGWPPG